MTPPHLFRHALSLVLCLSLASTAAHAVTAAERRVDTATAPHLALAQGGKPVTVHYAHLKDDYRASPGVKGHLDDLKQKVAFCIAANPRLGLPVRAPSEFPEQALRVHEFEYSAPNRRIVYAVVYKVRMADDCSLVEAEERNAVLSSAKGECTIDLVRKTAHGVCDARAHADAVAHPPAPGREQMEKTRAALEADPRLAERMAALRRVMGGPAPAGGPKRNIAGLACEMVQGAGGIHGCVSKAGSFIPTVGVEGVTLQRTVGKESSTAVEARLDMKTDPAIFAPYLKGGFTITAEQT
ncbi:hypothetical protein LK540_12650 [Massilia sp. IC2-278]|uniref:hypothetical protein n=1 Tax=Massilia sp. IC2-278 TaxID=2887200 RepID=UPI001E3090C8|nr:hypothetical protein [Massilia sp. IC2-278]MCC2961272.1 hypothetical protein [Massilia sp. IC2-278]